MKLADSVGHVKIATNTAWTLNTGYLVLFMQAGFALLTCGLVRKKNAGHLMMLNFAAYVFAFLAYYAVGYAFQFGAVAVNAAPANIGGTPTLNQFLLGSGQWGFLGGKGFFLTGPAYDASANTMMLFQVVFMETAGYIIVGSICERITFGAFLLCELFVGAILYPIFGCWVWGGGWMSQLGATMGLGHGYVDFAGSTVVHAVGGFCAMALAVILGPSARQVHRRRQASGVSRAQPGLCRHRHVHPAVWLDGIQSGLDPGRDRSADLGRGREHEPGGGRRVGVGAARLVSACSGSPISRWPATGCLLVWWRSRRRAHLSARRRRSSSASSRARWCAAACCSTSGS